MQMWLRRATWRLLALAGGTVFFLQGCDAQTRAAVEDGIITSSSSLIAAIMRALIELGQEAQQDESTARVLTDFAERMFA